MEDRLLLSGSPDQASRRRRRVGAIVLVALVVAGAGLVYGRARGRAEHCRARLRAVVEATQTRDREAKLEAAQRCYRGLVRLYPLSGEAVAARELLRKVEARGEVSASDRTRWGLDSAP